MSDTNNIQNNENGSIGYLIMKQSKQFASIVQQDHWIYNQIPLGEIDSENSR